MEVKPVMAFYRGHTHGEFAFPPTAPVARVIGNWARDKLSVKEFRPAGLYWNKVLGRREFLPKAWLIKKQFCFFNEKTDRFHVPIGYCDELKGIIESFGGEVKEIPLPNYPLRKMQIKMREFFMEKGKKIMIEERPWQVEPIKLCSDPSFGMKGLAMQTGKGKSFSILKASVNLGYATLVIVPGLVDQWIKTWMQFTTGHFKDGSIYKITGFETLNQLANNPSLKPDVFVASVATMRSFALGEENYKFLPWTYEKWLAAYGVGIKIVDECHKNFHTNTMMDLRSNVPYNFYLTATFLQNNKMQKRIFDVIYPPKIRVGEQLYDKYAHTYFYNFSGLVDEKYCTKTKGYSHSFYEAALLKSNKVFSSNFKNVILPTIQEHYIKRFKPGYKLLIFCYSIAYIERVVEELKLIYPDKRVISYTGNDKQDKLERGDIIVSNDSKAGTGLDLRGLVTVINTRSLASPPLAAQIFGRLRKIDDTDVVYVDFCDVNIHAHIRHAETRKDDLRRMSKVYNELNLSCESGLMTPIGQAPYGMTF